MHAYLRYVPAPLFVVVVVVAVAAAVVVVVVIAIARAAVLAVYETSREETIHVLSDRLPMSVPVLVKGLSLSSCIWLQFSFRQ